MLKDIFISLFVIGVYSAIETGITLLYCKYRCNE